MKRFLSIIRRDKKEIMDSIIFSLILVSTFLVLILSAFKDLPFVYNQF